MLDYLQIFQVISFSNQNAVLKIVVRLALFLPPLLKYLSS